jgi:hypothetical protein
VRLLADRTRQKFDREYQASTDYTRERDMKAVAERAWWDRLSISSSLSAMNLSKRCRSACVRSV